MPDPTAPRLPDGLPDFRAIDVPTLRAAVEDGMAAHRAEVEAIASAPTPASFADTIEALERAGQLLGRALRLLGNLGSSASTPELRTLEAELAPRLSAHRDAVRLDPRVLARIADLHDRADGLGLDPEQARLLWRHHRDLVRAGALLAPAEQERLRALNAELSEQQIAFGTKLLEATNALAVHVEDEVQLAGLPAEAIAGAAREAHERGHAGGFLLPLQLPVDQPVLAALADRGLRERVFRASIARGALGDEHDTRATLTRIAALRAERAALLGFPSHAAYVADDTMAGSVEAVLGLLDDLAPAAAANARREAAELEVLLRADGHEGPLEPWDWSFYAARARAARAGTDPEELRAHLELEAVLRDGLLRTASELYGLTFTERDDLELLVPEMRAWDVHTEDGALAGLFLLDPFARESKRGGAWMSQYVGQSKLLGTRPIVVNTLNIAPPAPGEPVLLTPDEVRILFHELGHALHNLLSDVTYPRLAGTSVPADFVEFPSQVNELWAWEPEVVARYARHHVTGAPLSPQALADLERSEAEGQGHGTFELLAAMVLDQAWHGLTPGEEVAPEDVEAFEARALEAHGLRMEQIPPRYRSTGFHHVFDGGYSAGYYSYLWAEVLDADAAAWFRERGGLRRDSGRLLADAVLSRGGTVDPMEAYRAFRGRDPEIGPLLRRRGLQPAEA